MQTNCTSVCMARHLNKVLENVLQPFNKNALSPLRYNIKGVYKEWAIWQ